MRPAAGGSLGAVAELRRLSAGADWEIDDRWLIGIGAAMGHGTLTHDRRGDSSRLMAPRLTAHVSLASGPLSSRVGASLARTTIDSRRTLRFAALAPTGDALLFDGIDRRAIGTASGHSGDIWIEERATIPLGGWQLQPGGGLRAAWHGREAWSERNAGALSLSGGDEVFRTLQADAGLRLTRASGWLRPHACGTYRRELGERQTFTRLALNGQLDAGSFMTQGAALAVGRVGGRAGVSMDAGGVDGYVAYELEHSSGMRRQSLVLSFGF